MHEHSTQKQQGFPSGLGPSQQARYVSVLAVVFGLLLCLWTTSPAFAASPSFDTSNLISPLTGNTMDIAVGDLDNDGDLDVVIGNECVIVDDSCSTGSYQNWVYLNDGVGNFDWSGSAIDLGGSSWHTYSVAVGDLDGDGYLDIVAGDDGYDRIYLNDGDSDGDGAWDGTFTTFSFGNKGHTLSVVLGDLNSDGHLDVATAKDGDYGEVWIGDGTGSLTLDGYYGTEWGENNDIALGDMDDDGHLDIVAGRDRFERSAVFLNDGSGGFYNVTGGTLDCGDTLVRCLGTDTDWTKKVAIGDVNGDGFLDVVTASQSDDNRLYLNDGTGTFTTNSTFGSSNGTWTDITLGDMDGDRDLDVIDGNGELFWNNGAGSLSTSDFFAGSNLDLNAVVPADVDGDGDLDILCSYNGYSSGAPNLVYFNDGAGSLASTSLGSTSQTRSAAVGDINGDGYLDVVIGRIDNLDRVYLNDGSGGFGSSYTFGFSSSRTWDLALGDVDGDGLLDIVTTDGGYLWGGTDSLNLHINNGDGTFASTALSHCSSCWTFAVALGDMDGDGDLDIIVGTQENPDSSNAHNRIHLNDGSGGFGSSYTFGGNEPWTSAIALGDLDGDGDLDVVQGSANITADTSEYGNFGKSNKIYLNDGAGNLDTVLDLGTGSDITHDVALGDLDGDGDLDIVIGNEGPDTIYFNDGQAGFDSTSYFGSLTDETRRVAVKDVNGDGDLDLVSGTSGGGRIYLNEGVGQFSLSTPARTFGGGGIYGLAVGDLDSDGTLDMVTGRGTSQVCFNPVRISDTLVNNPATPTLTRPSSTPDADFYSTPEILDSSEISITFSLYDAEGDSVGAIAAYYSFNGGGSWVTAVSTRTVTTNLAASPSRTAHTFIWDTFESGFFGQSDNVVFRLETWPNAQHPVGGVPGPFLWPYAASSTFPFRVQGTQVQVFSDTLPLENAIVYRLPAGQSSGAEPIADDADQPYETNAQGYLQGRGQIDVGDTLFALLPISATDTYTLYYTSGTPTETGLDGHVVEDPGVQTLTISPDKPLLLFNLDLSLEWDARNDGTFLDDLESAIQRASEVLYDVSDGQMAIGKVNVYQAKENWVSADVVMYAQNGIRPRASMGGVVDDLTDDVDRDSVTISNAYGPGQVRMGPNWDPFGMSLDELGQDWQQALAHELAHYLLYLPDNYLGVGAGSVPISTDCKGSFMTSTYDDAYSEFLTRSPWDADAECLQTVAENTTGRADWQTIQTFYGVLISPTIPLDGPSLLPLDVTEVIAVSLETSAETLTPSFFDVRDAQSLDLLSVSRAQGYLFKTQDNSDISDDQVIGLGSTVGDGDRIKVRGAEPGDRLCLFGPFDESTQSSYAGCIESLAESDRSIPMEEVTDWQPHIVVTAITSQTMAITVTLTASASDLHVQFFPAYGAPTSTLPIEAPWAAMLPFSPTQSSTFSQVITLDYPAFEGFVRVWVPGSDPVQEALSQVYLSPPWGPNTGGFRSGGDVRAWGANHRQLGAPVASGDGQVTIFNLEDIFADTGTVSLQAISSLPNLPAWLTQVGHGYRFVADEVFPRVIVLNYLQRDVPDGYEHTLRIYYSPDEGQTWQRLSTDLDTDHNQATAQMPDDEATDYGQGIYAVLSTIDMPSFEEGWNQFGYPLPGTRSVTQALDSIDGAYTSVYYYDTTAEEWVLHDETVLDEHPEYAELVSDLSELEFGRSYWLYATEAITLYLGVPAEGEATLTSSSADQPPATFYGPISPTTGFTPAVGMVISATIDGTVCGQGVVTDSVSIGQLTYKVQVAADTGDGCGGSTKVVVFVVDGWVMAETYTLDAVDPWNRQAWFHALSTPVMTIAGLTVTSDSPTALEDTTTFTASVASGDLISYTWDFGDGTALQLSSEPVVTHTYSAAGIYEATVTASNLTSETSATTSVRVEQTIVGLGAVNDSPTELGALTTLEATITAGSNVSFTWDFGDGGTGSGAVATHTYPDVGVYTAVVTASNSVGELVATTVVTITDATIVGLSAVNNSPTELGLPTALGTSVVAGSNVSYTWDFGDGQTGSGAVVAHTYPSVGAYTAIVTATNSVGTAVATTLVVITDVPIAGLSADNDSPTELGEPTMLLASSVAGSNVSYLWRFGDGASGNGAVTNHTYPEIGVYTAVVTASSSVGELVATTVVTITDVPIAGLGAVNDSPTELGALTTLEATITAGSNVSYTWDFGDGGSGSGAVAAHTYPDVGVYTAIVTASNSAGEVVATTMVTITDISIMELGVVNDGPTDLGTPTMLTATVAAGSNVSYTWDFGDGSAPLGIRGQVGNGAMTTHIYSDRGAYTVVVTATNSINQKVATTDVFVKYPFAVLTIVKTVEIMHDPVHLGGAIAYNLVVANHGDTDAFNVDIADVLPEGVRGNDLHWTGTISAGKQVEFTIPAVVTTERLYLGHMIINTATVTYHGEYQSTQAGFTIEGNPITRTFLPVVTKK